MKKVLVLSILLLATNLSLANNFANRIDVVISLIRSEPDSAYSLALKLLDDATDENDDYGIVQSNFILAYIHDDVNGDFGKAIIYYLEAIRHAEKSDYPKVHKDLISLHKNCGVIFRKFKSFSLAKEYYEIALNYAYELQDENEINSITFNQAGLFMDQNEFSTAIEILKKLIVNTETQSKNYWKYNNRLGIALFESGKFQEAIKAHDNSLNFEGLSKELKAYTLNNIGRCWSSLQEFDKAVLYFNEAIEIKKGLEDQSLLFSTYSELGELKLRTNHLTESLKYFNLAETYINEVDDVKNFDFYKLKADALFKLKKYNESKRYEDLYSVNLNKYLDLQEEIQATDRRYNMDLITKRYFDEVAKQERIASILLYSKLISGSLLALLLMSVGFNWYQKVRLRRSIVRELIDLKILD